MTMKKGDLRGHWNSTARAIGRIIERVQALPECEQDSHLDEQLQYAFCYAHKMCRVKNSDVNGEELSRWWDSIARDLDHVMKRAGRLAGYERDPRFHEKLNDAFYHADSRADALIEP